MDDAPNLSAPSLLMSANNLSATTEYIGNSTVFPGAFGDGWFSQSGGVNTVGSGGLYLGYSGRDIGEYDLSGGTASVAGNVTLANTSGTGFGGIVVSGTGALTVSGTLTAYQGGELDLNGGTVNAAMLNFNGVPARLQWTSGAFGRRNVSELIPRTKNRFDSFAFLCFLTFGA